VQEKISLAMSSINSYILKSMPVLLALILFSCSVNDKPQPINAGKDSCTACSMQIMDKKFACEIITTKGKALKFDDMSCMFHFIGKGKIAKEDVLRMYVSDFENPDSLIDVKTASLVLGSEIHSPMNGGVAAFSNKEHAVQFANDTKSELLDKWERLEMQH